MDQSGDAVIGARLLESMSRTEELREQQGHPKAPLLRLGLGKSQCTLKCFFVSACLDCSKAQPQPATPNQALPCQAPLRSLICMPDTLPLPNTLSSAATA